MDPHEKKSIHEPFEFDFYYFKQYIGKGNLYANKLQLYVVKNNKCHLVLEDSYGIIQGLPEGWRENELGQPSILYDGSAYKYNLYTVAKPKLLEKLVKSLLKK